MGAATPDPDIPDTDALLTIIRNADDGIYRLVLEGMFEPSSIHTHLMIRRQDTQGAEVSESIEFLTVVTEGTKSEYEVDYHRGLEVEVYVRKVVTPSSMKQELGAMQELGWFEDATLFDELDHHLQQAQDRLAQSDSAGAREAVAAFRARLNGAGDTIGENGYEILAADAESLQAQLPEAEDPAPPPPVNAKADVRPILECVIDNHDGTFTAYFGYENHHGEPVTIPHGSKNKITPAIYEQLQPEAFFIPNAVPGRPGRTAAYPAHAFSLTFDEDRRVRWKLGRGRVTASSRTERCPE